MHVAKGVCKDYIFFNKNLLILFVEVAKVRADHLTLCATR